MADFDSGLFTAVFTKLDNQIISEVPPTGDKLRVLRYARDHCSEYMFPNGFGSPSPLQFIVDAKARLES